MLSWDETQLKLNNDSMDTLHREFIEIYNKPFNNQCDFATALKEIIIHTKEHFAFEEDIMNTFDYSNTIEHTEEHKKALYEMEMFLQKSNSLFGKKLMEAYYKEKLADWFKMHIRNMDSDFHMQQVQKGIYKESKPNLI